MAYSEDSYAAMLLTLALSPDKEEYARPLSTSEFRRLEETVRQSPYQRLGQILAVDISGLMIKLGLREDFAYRLYTLMNRGVQLTYAIENYYDRGIRIVTQYDEEYPQRLSHRLGDNAPPALYMAGHEAEPDALRVSVLGIGGVRTTPQVRDAVETLVRNAARLGACVLTGGEPGVAHVAEEMASLYKCPLAEVLGGGMGERLADGGANPAAWTLSLEHPDALLTAAHAATRNRALLALSDAAFVFNTDGKRGDAEAVANHVCDFIYAWREHPSTQALISRGAYPLSDMSSLNFDTLARKWKGGRARQVSMFEMMEEEE